MAKIQNTDAIKLSEDVEQQELWSTTAGGNIK